MRAWHRSPEFLAAHKAYTDAVEARSMIDVNTPGWHTLRREAAADIDRAQEALAKAKADWWARHSWRMFANLTQSTRRAA